MVPSLTAMGKIPVSIRGEAVEFGKRHVLRNGRLLTVNVESLISSFSIIRWFLLALGDDTS